MCRLSFIALLAALSLGAQLEQPAQPRDQASKQELQRIQGAWKLESLHENGEAVAFDDLNDRTIFFGGGTFVVRQRTQVLQAGNQNLDPTKAPKTINAMIMHGERKGDILLGIYDLDGDSLKICFDLEGQKRPIEFANDPRSGVVQAVYKRQKTDENPEPNIAGEYTSALDGNQAADVVIEKLGECFSLTWKRNNAVVSTALGIRRGDILSLGWETQAQRGVAVYEIKKDGKLVGKYTTLGGIGLLAEETLTPKRTID